MPTHFLDEGRVGKAPCVRCIPCHPRCQTIDKIVKIWYYVLLMSPIEKTPSHQRRKELLTRSSEVLAHMPQTYGTQSIILSENEASHIGEAIHRRNHRAIYDTIGGVIDSAVEDYEGTNAAECIGLWNNATASLFGDDVKIGDLLASDATRELLNIALSQSETTQLGLDTTEYLKLLESVAVTFMPEEGFTTYSDSRRARVGGSPKALFYRVVTSLNRIAELEPGMRTVREDVLNTDPNALNKYLASLVRARSAQASLGMLLEMTPHDIRRQKAGLERTFANVDEAHDLEIEDMLHILEWKMLTGSEDRETRHKRIKAIIEGQSSTERQRRQVAYDWCPERLDFLIEIAETAQLEGRNPSMYISNRFEEGAGVYVAVELDNPHDASQKMLFADNPIAGNALYIVDEARLENEGRPNSWHNVLGASRRIARERGAIRKYHTKNWQDILGTVMSMGEPLQQHTTERPVTTHESTEQPTTVDSDQLIEESQALRAKLEALIAAARPLIK